MNMKTRVSLPLIKTCILLVLVFWSTNIFSQITTEPALPTDADEVLITFDATGTGLEGYDGDVYAHTGVTIDDDRWEYVVGPDWIDPDDPQLNRVGDDLYELLITPSIREFYDVPADENITEMCFVFRNTDGSQQTEDLFVNVYQAGLNVSIINPPKDKPIVEHNSTLEIKAVATYANELTLYINDVEVETTTDDEIEYSFVADEYGTFWIKAIAEDDEDQVVDSTYIYVRPDPQEEELPEGVTPGANYIDESTVILVLHDPPALKEYVFAIGDFNDWMTNDESYMKRTPDGTHYWITLEDLTPGEEYGYQYFIDNELRLADPYTHKILDPWNDPWIDEHNYPDLKPYPTGKTNGYVSIIHPDMPEYEWEVTDFTPPDVEDLVIYELLIRDFVNEDGEGAIKDITADYLDYLEELGVNAIELMPINQFEGNNSWGYNPALYFATDKAYGTRQDYKAFIDECHKRGIAVFIDIVLNHSFNMSPMVQMYFDPDAGGWGQPLPENPWYLEECPTDPWCWGQTFDQDSPYTHVFFDRVAEYWLTEFNIDGFRYDFTKGFANDPGNYPYSQYNQDRIDNLTRIYNHIKSVNSDAHVILEHFCDNDEEKHLANKGMLIWGNMNHSYGEATMGWIDDSDFSWISYTQRGWDVPHLVGYMESHDEERLMYKNQMYGNSNSGYDIRDLETALERMELAGTFFFTIPGPKMIWQFGELGYDYSINHCGSEPVDPIPGNIGDCRVDRKPVRWDYYDEWKRKSLYNIYSALIELKKEQEVFKTNDYSLHLGGAIKRIHLNHETAYVTVLGNFDVTERQLAPHFQETGTWYEFFTREELEVEEINQTITLQPGEYRLYSNVEFPDHGFNVGTIPFVKQKPGISVYPNPSRTGFYFEFKNNEQYSNARLEIINIQGQVIFSKNIDLQSNEIYWNGNTASGEKATEGVYFYKITVDDNTLTGRLMVK